MSLKRTPISSNVRASSIRSPKIEIGNRDEAIEFAIQQLQGSDSLLIAGKGHESLQLIGSETLPFSDAVVARNIVKRLNDASQITGDSQ